MKAKTEVKTKSILYQKRGILLFVLPAALLTLIFSYLPMVGLLMAFKDYSLFDSPIGPFISIFTSEWVGMEHFRKIYSDPKFLQVFFNTIQISLLKTFFIFPLPIFIAISLNEIIWPKVKKTIQTILYLPHFLSWVIVSGIWVSVLGGAGIINNLLFNADLITTPIPFLTDGLLFIPVLLFTDAWKGIGWGAIIYLAAITSIDYNLYEAIKIDGGGKLKEIYHITLPGITNTIVMMFILSMAGIMSAGFDQIFNMYSPYVYDVADVISTYTFRLGLGSGEYSEATAIGLFNSVISFALIMSANKLCRKYLARGIW